MKSTRIKVILENKEIIIFGLKGSVYLTSGGIYLFGYKIMHPSKYKIGDRLKSWKIDDNSLMTKELISPIKSIKKIVFVTTPKTK